MSGTSTASGVRSTTLGSRGPSVAGTSTGAAAAGATATGASEDEAEEGRRAGARMARDPVRRRRRRHALRWDVDYDPERPLADLREIAELTGGPDGARRVAWTDEWLRAREWLKGRLAELPVDVREDAAGQPVGDDDRRRRHRARRRLARRLGARTAAGSTARSASAGRSRCCARHAADPPPVTLRLVDWADEEGARFGRSLFGSSAAAGTLVPDDVRELRDADGTTLPDALAARGLDLDRVGEAAGGLDDAGAYLELHIEQGPVLEELGIPAGAVIGCYGVERHAVTFSGRAQPRRARRRWTCATTPSWPPRASRLAVRDGAPRARRRGDDRHGAGRARRADDHQRALRGDARPARLRPRGARRRCSPTRAAAADEAAAAEGVEVTWRRIWSIDPTPFHPDLVDLAERACTEVTGSAHRLPSGALHDAAEAARLVPTVMVFSSSTDGISHSPDRGHARGRPARRAVGLRAAGRADRGTPGGAADMSAAPALRRS